MKIIGLSVVRNEVDIIEAATRSNLSILDELIIVDNGSTDGTYEVLQALQKEGAPIALRRDPSMSHQQAARMSALLRECERRPDIGYIVLLDADEILVTAPARGSVRDAFLAALGAIPDRVLPLIAWRTYVPTPSDDQKEPNPLRRIVYRRSMELPEVVGERLITDGSKAIIPRAFLRSCEVSEGNHIIRLADGTIPSGKRLREAWLAHFPVRSSDQVVAKVLLGEWSLRMKPSRGKNEGWHWKHLSRRLMGAPRLDPSELQQIALTYVGVPPSDLIFDPVPEPAGLRYLALGSINLTARLIGFADSMVRRSVSVADASEDVKELSSGTPASDLRGATSRPVAPAPDGRETDAYLEGEAALRARVASSPEDPVAWASLGRFLRARGEHAEAIACYTRACALPTAPAAVWFNLGNALLEAGRGADAEPAFARVLALAPELAAAAHLQLARCAVARGAPGEAREHFNQTLRREPENFSAWLEAGNACRNLGAFDQMRVCYERAVAVAPARWAGHASLARCLEDLGQRDRAGGHYYLALCAEDAGTGHEVHRLIARGRAGRGDFGGAIEAFARIVAASPEDHEVQIDLGDVLHRAGFLEPAQRVFEQAARATDKATLVRLASAVFQFNLHQEAKAILERARALHPEASDVRLALAKLKAEVWEIDEALAELDAAEGKGAPGPAPATREIRASIAARLGDIDTCMRLYRETADAQGPGSPCYDSVAMAALYSDTMSAAEVAALHRSLFAPLGEGARPRARFPNPRDPERRLRLGYVSADIHHQHPVNIFIQPVLARHDRRSFEVSLYFVGRAIDDQTRLARSRVERWRDAAAMNDRQLAEIIQADGIDILVDLAGHTSLNRLRLFAQRAAPVQVTFIGYPGSTGVPNIDWMVVDPVVAPPGSEPLFSERLARLPGTVFCYAPDADYPYPSYDDSHARRPLTFGSFNNVPKLTPHTLRLWACVLAAVPGSRLVLKAPSFGDPGAVRRFRGLLTERGVDPARLEFRGPVGLAEMMAEYADIDIALDPVPYNGGTTTLQAMWMGVPVVVKAGDAFVSRMGASFMGAVGLADWVADDDDAYVRIAAAKAADRAGLLAVKQTLRQRMLASPVSRVDDYTRQLDGLFRQAWRTHCREM